MGRREAVVYGRRACLAVAEYRPEAILRVLYHEGSPHRDLAPLFKACARQKRPYRQVSTEDLLRVSGSEHHEGVVVVTHPHRSMSLSDYFETRDSRAPHVPDTPLPLPIWIALDGVENDHNHGAIARTLAWFGAEGILWAGRSAQLSGAALRIAQGGAERVQLITVPSLVDALTFLKRHQILILGADQRGSPLRAQPQQLSQKKGICWVMGSEQHGLSEATKRCCDHLLSIPGSGAIESLNVSVSAGILIAQSYTWLNA